jgi:hypothetical protein
MLLLGRVLINRDRSVTLIEVRSTPASGAKANIAGGPSRANTRPGGINVQGLRFRLVSRSADHAFENEI